MPRCMRIHRSLPMALALYQGPVEGFSSVSWQLALVTLQFPSLSISLSVIGYTVLTRVYSCDILALR